MKNRKLLLVIAALLVTGAISGRLYARHYAVSFGRRLAGALSVVGPEGFADTAELRSFFSQPEMAGYRRSARQLSILGGDYAERMDDLQMGLIYCSEQASLPPERRFASPPTLKRLTLNAPNPSDKELIEAATSLILSYTSQL